MVVAVEKEDAIGVVAPVQRATIAWGRGLARLGPVRLATTWYAGTVRCGAEWSRAERRGAPEVGREDLELRHVTPKVHKSRVGRSRRALNLPPTSTKPAS